MCVWGVYIYLPKTHPKKPQPFPQKNKNIWGSLFLLQPILNVIRFWFVFFFKRKFISGVRKPNSWFQLYQCGTVTILQCKIKEFCLLLRKHYRSIQSLHYKYLKYQSSSVVYQPPFDPSWRAWIWAAAGIAYSFHSWRFGLRLLACWRKRLINCSKNIGCFGLKPKIYFLYFKLHIQILLTCTIA